MTAAPFVGRERELAAVRGVLERARAGSGSAVVVQGPGGIGKSRLVTEAIAATDGLTVLHVSCGELERDMPFAAIATALDLRRSSTDPQAAALAALIGDPGGEDIRFRVVDEIIDLLERRALDSPVVVVLDDVHRADPGTLLVAKRLARAGSVLPVALVCTRRPYPGRPDVDEALADAEIAELDALSSEELSNLAAGILGASPGASLTSAIERAGGNPLYAKELVRSLDADRRIERAEGIADLVSGELPASLRLTILAQLSFLDDDAVLVLRIASCFGTSFDPRDIGLVLDRSVADLQRVLEPAIRAAVIVDAAERLSFRHDLVREAIYDDMPEAIRVGLHAEIAASLTAADRPVTELAPHVLRSARAGDVASVELLRRAAAAAMALSAVTAVELLTHARSLAPLSYAERDDLALELALALSTTGRQADAETLAREVLTATADPAAAQRARGVIVQAARARDRVSGVVDVLEQLEASEPRDARLLALAARAWAQLGEGERAEPIAREALELAELVGDDEARCLAVWARMWAAAHGGRVVDVMTHLTQAVTITRTATVEPGTRADVAHGYLSLFGRFEPLRPEARTVVVEELRRAEAAGHLWVIPMLHVILAFDHLCHCEYDDAVLAADTAIRVSSEVGGSRNLSSAYATLARAGAYLGDLESPERHLATAEALAADEDDPVVGVAEISTSRAIFERARGRPEAAADAVWAMFQIMQASEVLSELLGMESHFLARLLVSAGRTDDAKAVQSWVESIAGSSATNELFRPGVELSCAAVRAIVDRDLDAARASVEGHRPGLLILFLDAVEDAADVIAEHGETAEAAALLEEALAGWERVGGPLRAARITARLRELGVRRGVTGTRGRPTSGWDALTEAELRVADLVADNLTYREIGERLFLSRRTVESHVARVFTKLDLSSRRDLAAEVVRRRSP